MIECHYAGRIACAWLRNDLRVHDSPVLHRAAELAKSRDFRVLPVYVLDPRHFQRTKHGTLKTGPLRARFLLQSILALKQRLRQLDSDLLIRVGRPEEVLADLLLGGSVLVTQQEVTSEELLDDRRVRDAIGQDVLWEYCWGSTLFHKDDLALHDDLSDMPDVYTHFKNFVEPELKCKVNEIPPSFNETPKLESNIRIRQCLPALDKGSLPLPTIDPLVFQFEPSWDDLPFAETVRTPTPHSAGVMDFQGGEDAGLARLQYYIRETGLVSKFADTRNEMLGADYSSKFAPWLARGCLSPRKVFEELREHEKRQASGRSTYWFLFALMARDFFRLFALKHGTRIFKEGGVVERSPKWRGGHVEFELWAEGSTGFPLVDANMRELKASGFMSNRGRQNVASFLVLDLGVDWRRGADWFESHLVDYDVTSNWVCWLFAAGLNNSGRVNRFNVLKQSMQYDPNGDYIRHWVPELRRVPAPLVHQPWLMSIDERTKFGAELYPHPCLDPGSFPAPGAPRKSAQGGYASATSAQGSRRGGNSSGARASQKLGQSSDSEKHRETSRKARTDGQSSNKTEHANSSIKHNIQGGRVWKSSTASLGEPSEIHHSAVPDEFQGNEQHSTIKNWLNNLDGGSGACLIYGETLTSTFSSARDLIAHYTENGCGEFDVDEFCKVHGVGKLAHRRFLERWVDKFPLRIPSL